MPKLADHPSSKLTKLLFIGDSGAGKTGALAALAKAGYNLRIVDFDAGCDILLNLLRDDPAAMDRVIVETYTDKLKAVGGQIVPDGVPNAFSNALNTLTHWKFPERIGPAGEKWEAYDLGKITSWGPQDVLVLDSLSLFSEAAMRYVLAINGRQPGKAQLQDWGQMGSMVEAVIQLLYSSQVGCNVIVNTHIKVQGEEGEVKRGLPNCLGQKIPSTVGRYFNSVLLARTVGTGNSAKRQIVTRPEGIIELKNAAPKRVPATLPLETGLAEFFKMMQEG